LLASDYTALDAFVRGLMRSETCDYVGICVLGYNPSTNTLLIELKVKGGIL